MRHFVDDLSAINRPALAVFLDRAQGIYDENMSQYIRLMLRRSFGRLIVRLTIVARVKLIYPGLLRGRRQGPTKYTSIRSLSSPYLVEISLEETAQRLYCERYA